MTAANQAPAAKVPVVPNALGRPASRRFIPTTTGIFAHFALGLSLLSISSTRRGGPDSRQRVSFPGFGATKFRRPTRSCA
ncbi:hypothetical protein OBBRIDRAFT_160312 [Obba rivulosa]|uniref:Uncharacterized protein n=1 Tax=Obba rivulosa TaxID=1052685 RepID=A0A8E2AMS5_9APHY|nr:hypothetical protein OBBRIDRAFT_160312 [Obba rivulosa]